MICPTIRDRARHPSRPREGQRDLRACSLVAAGWAIAPCLPPTPPACGRGEDTPTIVIPTPFVIPGLTRDPPSFVRTALKKSHTKTRRRQLTKNPFFWNRAGRNNGYATTTSIGRTALFVSSCENIRNRLRGGLAQHLIHPCRHQHARRTMPRLAEPVAPLTRLHIQFQRSRPRRARFADEPRRGIDSA